MERGLWRFVSFYGDPLADCDAAADADPRWIAPALLRAAFLLSVTEPGWVADARRAIDEAQSLAAQATPRELAHLDALSACAAGRWQHATQHWDAILVEHPRDLLALFCAHLFDFYRGDAVNLRQRVARVLPEWPRDDPLSPYVLGMYAFGLEECNLYPQAEAAGRAALDADARGPWAIHAVAHVMEMQGGFEEGSAWLDARREQWAIDNGFAVHLWWHAALFRLERMDLEGALAYYDANHADEAAQSIHLLRLDAVALLWRLHLLGIEGGERWKRTAGRYAGSRAEAGLYAFNDLFALIAFVGAGDLREARVIARAVENRAQDGADDGDNRVMAREVALPLAHGLIDFAEGRFDAAVESMRPVRAIAQRFGGSHAQRDIIDQTLLAACARGSQRSRALGRALLNERRLAKPVTPLTAHWASRVG
jgi:hypothetical protein